MASDDEAGDLREVLTPPLAGGKPTAPEKEDAVESKTAAATAPWHPLTMPGKVAAKATASTAAGSTVEDAESQADEEEEDGVERPCHRVAPAAAALQRCKTGSCFSPPDRPRNSQAAVCPAAAALASKQRRSAAPLGAGGCRVNAPPAAERQPAAPGADPSGAKRNTVRIHNFGVQIHGRASQCREEAPQQQPQPAGWGLTDASGRKELQDSFMAATSSATSTESARPAEGAPCSFGVEVPRRSSNLLARRKNLSLTLNTASAKQEAIAATGVAHRGSLNLEQLSERYDIAQIVSQGSVAVVHRATRRQDGRQVALKVVRSVDEEMIRIVQREYEVLRSIRHPHIIQAIECVTLVDRAVLVMDYFDGVELASAVPRASSRHLSEASAHQLFVPLVEAVDYLHQHRIVHRDIKPQNVLVSRDLAHTKLVDFNTARCLEDGGSLTMTGTQLYLAPEVLLGESPSQEGDVWAAGLCLHFMVSGGLPQGRDRLAKANLPELRRCSLVEPTFEGWRDVSADCKAALERALAVDPLSRPCATDLLSMAWLRRGPWAA